MKLQRRIAIWSGVISALALGVSIILNLVGCSFSSSVCVGVFSSGIVVCVVSVVTFYNERDRELKRLSEKTFELMMSEVANSRNDGNIDIYELRRNVEAILRLCLVDIRNCVYDLSELHHNSELYKIVEGIWEHTRKIGAAYSNDYHMILQYIGNMVSDKDIEQYEFEFVSEKTEECRKQLRDSLDQLDAHMRVTAQKATKGTPGEGKNNAD